MCQYTSPHSLYVLLQGLGTNAGLCYGSYVTPLGHGMNLVQTDSLPSTQVLVPGSQPVAAQSSSSSICTCSTSSSSQKLQRPDKLEVLMRESARDRWWTPCQSLLCSRSSKVCREFQRGNCARAETDCRFAHPSDSPMIDTTDNTVTVCMDYIKGRCSREKCKYFHPPAHLQAKIKSSQQHISQTAAPGQTASVVRPCSVRLSVCVNV